jgi:hypothetical protein
VAAGRLAQLVERLPYTQVAAGSSPAPPIAHVAPMGVRLNHAIRSVRFVPKSRSRAVPGAVLEIRGPALVRLHEKREKHEKVGARERPSPAVVISPRVQRTLESVVAELVVELVRRTGRGHVDRGGMR